MGFPETSEDIEALNYYVLYTKYYIYIQQLFNNNELDLYLFEIQIKTAIMIEYNICKNSYELHRFFFFYKTGFTFFISGSCHFLENYLVLILINN